MNGKKDRKKLRRKKKERNGTGSERNKERNLRRRGVFQSVEKKSVALLKTLDLCYKQNVVFAK